MCPASGWREKCAGLRWGSLVPPLGEWDPWETLDLARQGEAPGCLRGPSPGGRLWKVLEREGCPDLGEVDQEMPAGEVWM